MRHRLAFATLCLLLLAPLGCGGNSLGNGYSRKGENTYFRGKRIDRAGAHDIKEFAVIVRHPLKLCSDVDAASFRVLSQDYTADKNKVYYKWISGPRFWVVEISGADPATFEVLGLGLATLVALSVAMPAPAFAQKIRSQDIEQRWQLLEYRDLAGDTQLVPAGIGATVHDGIV